MLDQRKKTDSILIIKRIGLLFVALSLLVSVIVFAPLLWSEVAYNKVQKAAQGFEKKQILMEEPIVELDVPVIVPIDQEFSIIIPKIDANYKVIKDVDPFNSSVYQEELAKGVAHALGSVYPGQSGSSFYFAHSSDTIINANRYNAMFYLIKKLETGDTFFLVYENEIYEYEIIKTQFVNPENVDLINMNTNKKLAILMTCWPPGTTLQRYIVVGELVLSN